MSDERGMREQKETLAIHRDGRPLRDNKASSADTQLWKGFASIIKAALIYRVVC